MSRPRHRDPNGYSAVIASPLAGVPAIGLHIIENRLSGIDLQPTTLQPYGRENRVVEQFIAWLDQYASNPCGTSATVALGMAGTPFQQRVWQALREVGCGETLTYGQLARALGSGAQAVAGACRANPLPLIVPCHRVVSASGVGGFMGMSSGAAIELKLWLLAHEHAY
jgi:methylated-DNA-[protein]-cysteine S-methyltransferase